MLEKQSNFALLFPFNMEVLRIHDNAHQVQPRLSFTAAYKSANTNGMLRKMA
jgi:hypothetical protein